MAFRVSDHKCRMWFWPAQASRFFWDGGRPQFDLPTMGTGGGLLRRAYSSAVDLCHVRRAVSSSLSYNVL